MVNPSTYDYIHRLTSSLLDRDFIVFCALVQRMWQVYEFGNWLDDHWVRRVELRRRIQDWKVVHTIQLEHAETNKLVRLGTSKISFIKYSLHCGAVYFACCRCILSCERLDVVLVRYTQWCHFLLSFRFCSRLRAFSF